MPRRKPQSYTLSAELVATHAGANVICLDERATGRAYQLHAARPGPETNRRLRADGGDPYGGLLDEPSTVDSTSPALCIVTISGVLEQRAGYHDVCSGWTDGHDAVAERLCAAFAEGDVLLVVDSPGGACAGLQEAVRTALKSKAEHGRHVTAWADEQIGSAAAWWTLAVADEVYVPEAGSLGSIGARYAHVSVAEALKRDGVAVTHITWPNEGKVALASDMPLSDEGRARAQRDINDAGEAFAAAVLAGPVGQRNGLTYDALVALSADMLTGRRAVAAGLADGVASFDEVMTYALALASGDEGIMPKNTAASEYEKKTTERFTDDGEPPPADESEEEKDPEDEEAEEDDAPADAEGDEPEESAEDDDGPPQSKREPAKDARAKAPKAMRQSASLAEILGASSDSMPALKTAAINLRQVRDHGAKLTGQRSSGAIIGGMSALAEDAAESGKLRESLRSEQRRSNRRERMDLLNKLARANVPGYARGDLFVDEVDDRNKQVGVKPAKAYAEMKLSTLRGLVSGKIANAGPGKKKTPFEPDRKAAEEHATSIPTGKDQDVASHFGHSASDVAKSRAALFG